MTRLYKDKAGRYWILKGNILIETGRGLCGRRRAFSHPNINHKANLANGMALIGNNYKVNRL